MDLPFYVLLSQFDESVEKVTINVNGTFEKANSNDESLVVDDDDDDDDDDGNNKGAAKQTLDVSSDNGTENMKRVKYDDIIIID